MEIKGSLVLLIAVLFLQILPSYHTANGSPEFDVKYYIKSVTDGSIRSDEYPASYPVGTGCTVFLSEDGKFLNIGAQIVDTTENGHKDAVLILLDKEGHRSATTMIDDVRINVTRGGALEYSWAPAGAWQVIQPPTNLTWGYTSSGTQWSVELSIPYEEMLMTPGAQHTVGFMISVINNGLISLTYPQTGNSTNPSTWERLTSSSLWGIVDVAAKAIAIKPSFPKIGEPSTLIVFFQNVQTTPIGGIKVELKKGETSLGNVSYPGTLRAGQIGNVSFSWTAERGSWTFKAHVSIEGNPFEKDLENNGVSSSTITPVFITLTVKGPLGSLVSTLNVDENETLPVTGDQVQFQKRYGPILVSISRTLEVAGVRWLFSEWKDKGVQINALQLNLTEDTTVEALYTPYYRCTFAFIDKANRRADNVTFRISLPNATVRDFPAPGLIYIPQGTCKILAVYAGSVNVLEEIQTVYVETPLDQTYVINLRDVTIKVVDIFGFPVQGATVNVFFLNGTEISLNLPQDGIIVMSKVPYGRLNVTASYVSARSQIQVDATSNPAKVEWKMVLSLSLPVIGVMIGVTLVLLVVVFTLLFWPRLRPKKKEQPVVQ